MIAKSNSNVISCMASGRGSGGYQPKSTEKEYNRLVKSKRMGSGVYLIQSCQYKNIVVASRSVPILFIVICFLLVNTMCDEVGSANELVKADYKLDKDDDKSLNSKSSTSGTDTKPNTKFDPLTVLREIYLDHDSKIITLLSPSNIDTVQKFHTNGRYGRRSVNNLIGEPTTAHTELGKLNTNYDDIDGPLQSLLSTSLIHNPNLRAKNKLLQSPAASMDDSWLADSGISNLYWCDTGN